MSQLGPCDPDLPRAASPPAPSVGDDMDRMVQIEKLIAELQSTRDRFGNTCVYIRRGGLSWGAVALNRRDDDKKFGVFDLQAQHDRDMVQRAGQVERLLADKAELSETVAAQAKTIEGLERKLADSRMLQDAAFYDKRNAEATLDELKRDWGISAAECSRCIAALEARATTAETEVERLRVINRNLVNSHNTLLIDGADWERKAKAFESRLETARGALEYIIQRRAIRPAEKSRDGDTLDAICHIAGAALADLAALPSPLITKDTDNA